MAPVADLFSTQTRNINEGIKLHEFVVTLSKGKGNTNARLRWIVNIYHPLQIKCLLGTAILTSQPACIHLPGSSIIFCGNS